MAWLSTTVFKLLLPEYALSALTCRIVKFCAVALTKGLK
jgi:hypothetical protein